MAEETAQTTDGQAATQPDQFETRAREMGWKPQDQFPGDPEKWVDAKTFVERGEHVLPLVRAENRRLQEQLERLRREREADRQALTEARESIDGLKEFNRQQAAAELKAERRQLRAQLIEARREGDSELELQLQEKLDDLDDRAQQQTAETATTKTGNGEGRTAADATAQGDPTQRPEFQQFMRENPWFEQNAAMRAASLAIMQEAAQQGKLEGMTPAQRFSWVAAETRKAFRMEQDPPTDSKVGGATGPTGGGGGGRSYTDLPADAKAACDRFAKRMVGPNKAFADVNAWRKHYVQNYDWS